MDHIKLSAQKRTVTGKAVRHLRREGVVPVVVYGGTLQESVSLQMAEKELARALQRAGTTQLIDIQVDGDKSYPVLVRTVQRHPTRHELTHVDFLSVRLDQLIQAEIPLHPVGEPALVESNEAILFQAANHLTVEALPEALPSFLEVDVTSLTEVGASITAGDVRLAEGVTLVTDPETMLYSLSPLAREVEEEVEEVEEAEEGAEEAEGAAEEESADEDGGGEGE